MSQYNIDRYKCNCGRNNLYAYLSIACMALLVYVLFWHRPEKANEAVPARDTIVVRDTFLMPVAVIDTFIDTVYRTLPVVETVRTDTVTIRDSIMVEIPISRKVYEDSTYRAIVSGYEPNLEEIIIKHREITVTPMQRIKRWQIEPSAGLRLVKDQKETYMDIGIRYLLNNRWNIKPSAGALFGKSGIDPYVKIEVNHSLYSW